MTLKIGAVRALSAQDPRAAQTLLEELVGDSAAAMTAVRELSRACSLRSSRPAV